MTEWLLVLAAVALTAGTALFVAAEFSLVALDRPSVQQAVDDGDERARHRARGRCASCRPSCPAAQVGITLTTLVVGYLAEPSIGWLLHGPLESAGPVAPRVEAVVARRWPSLHRDALLDGLRRADAAVPRRSARRSRRPRWSPRPVRAFAVARPAADRRPQRLGQPRPAGDRHHAAGGAVRRPHPAGARLAWSGGRPRRAPSTPAPRGC